MTAVAQFILAFLEVMVAARALNPAPTRRRRLIRRTRRVRVYGVGGDGHRFQTDWRA